MFTAGIRACRCGGGVRKSKSGTPTKARGATTLHSPQTVTPITALTPPDAYIQRHGFSRAASHTAARRYAMPTLPQVSRLSLKTILFPTDFSPASRAALPFARSLARIYGSTLVAEHAIAPEPHPQIVTDRIPAQDNAAWDDARHKMDAFTRDWSASFGPWKTLVDRGDLADVIPEIIQEQSVDLIVLGTHGRRGVSKMIMGSSAEKIYRSAT